ncbi:MAG: rhomboid family intramembrane serine protease [Ignavibacteriae bacterium HGW-Ignavibacteriae-3]|nr:MAG: rhomboid family intramembrane serine protease [Ignavibacteriae bacterium HGW-Ignavibacteriae-3]
MGIDSRDYYRPSGMGGFSFFPPMIKYLLFANGIVFFIQLLAPMIIYPGLIYGQAVTFDYILTKYFALNSFAGDFPFYPWQLITYQFMHGDFSHILFNMFFLWMFGMEIENSMGSRKFIIFYLVGGIGAGLFQLILSPMISVGGGSTVGASGAIWAVMVAYAMFFPDRYILFWFLIPIKAKYLIFFFFLFEFFAIGDASLIAHLAHVGGAVTGFAFILFDRRNQFSGRNFFGSHKKHNNSFSAGGFQDRFMKNPFKQKDVEEAKFYDINDSGNVDDTYNQDEIDRILDKISKSGYQNLSEREKKILFEASKRK